MLTKLAKITELSKLLYENRTDSNTKLNVIHICFINQCVSWQSNFHYFVNLVQNYIIELFIYNFGDSDKL